MVTARLPVAPSTLVVVSHVVHYRHQDRWFAFGGYAREIDIWADLFERVIIAAPVRHQAPPGDNLPFMRANITLAPQIETGGRSLTAKVCQGFMVPALLWNLARAARRGGVVHVRCPGNLGLLGAVLAPALSRRCIAKYAGQWNGYPGEPITVRIQRAILRSRWWRNGLVTVYGNWPDQPAHVVPFFTSVMTREQVRRAGEIAARKRLVQPGHILYAGRLAHTKRVDLLLRAARSVLDRGLALRLTIIGDGPERAALERLAASLDLCGAVEFIGAIPYDQVMRWYAAAHVLVLPSSHSEGWPKVIAEAMTHGLVCIGTDHGFIPKMLGGRGYIFPVGDHDALAHCLEAALTDARRFEELSRAAADWGRRHCIEDLRDALRELIEKRWCTRRN